MIEENKSLLKLLVLLKTGGFIGFFITMKCMCLLYGICEYSDITINVVLVFLTILASVMVILIMKEIEK